MAAKKTITRRWLLYGFSFIAVFLLVAAVTLMVLLRSFYYQSAQDVLSGRANLFGRSVSSSLQQTQDFSREAARLVESFDSKEQMELQVLSADGWILASSTGFVPASGEAAEEFRRARGTDDGRAVQTTHNSNGEHIMALTATVTAADGTVIGALRYVVTLRLIDRQLILIAALVGIIVLIILLFTALSGLYFIRSIVHPVEEIGRAARRIAKGDYAYRVEKHSRDEIGDLCDTINYMATEIERAERLKNEFISSVSHELRTPLTAIRGWSETLQQTPDDPETVRCGMQIITDETERLSGMVEELLDFSRMQSGKLTLHFETVDVAAIVRETVLLFRERAENKGIHLQFVGKDALPPISGDADRLRQVFINVLDNAIKYSDSGDTVRVDYAAVGKTVQVVIGDTGNGISAADLPQVKMKFYKANTTRPGSGIGLAVADEIIEGHGGTLDIYSKEGFGTSVIITLPTEQKEQA